MSSRARIALIALALVVLVAAFVIASGSSDTSRKQDRTGAVATAPAAVPTTTTGGADTTPPPATTTTTTPPAPAPPVVRVVGAKPQGGVKRLTFTKGDTIAFTVQSDTADEIHVHGYDVHKDVKAGGKVTFSIPATIEGRFVVELEQHGTEIAELEVVPS
jgi:hypothetical protein